MIDSNERKCQNQPPPFRAPEEMKGEVGWGGVEVEEDGTDDHLPSPFQNRAT